MTGAAATAHEPVLLGEALEALDVRPGSSHLDGTIDGAGHATRILEASRPDGRLLGIDRDPAAVRRARTRCAPFGDRCTIVRGSFEDMRPIAADHGFGRFDGILLDLGFSSDQLDDASRGFSFRSEGPLDMRLDPQSSLTASDIVNTWTETDLADVLYRQGEERRSRSIARAICGARPIATTTELADVVARAAGGRRGRIHPATRTFQALRIAVNDELGAIERVLPEAIELLVDGGRLVVISFHSLEDRIVKQALRYASSDCVCPPELPECRCRHEAVLSLPTRRAVKPSPQEVRANPRARSARLRVGERLPRPANPRTEGGAA